MFKTIPFHLAVTVFALLLCVNRASAEQQTPDEPKGPVTFLDKTIEMYRAEIQMADLAMDRAQDARVKDFAQGIVRDDTMALRRFEDLLPNSIPDPTADNVSDNVHGDPGDQGDQVAIREKPDATTTRTDITNGISMTSQHMEMRDRLSQLSDESFDTDFMNVMVNEYRAMIPMFEREASITEATRPRRATDTAKMARELLPTLRQRLMEAEELQQQLH